MCARTVLILFEKTILKAPLVAYISTRQTPHLSADGRVEVFTTENEAPEGCSKEGGLAFRQRGRMP
jgi:hypothetical protein